MGEDMSDFFDEMLSVSPMDKWIEIILNASPTLVATELESIIEKLVIYEAIIESKLTDFQTCFESYKLSHKEEIDNAKSSFVIESMGKILGSHE